MDNILNVYLLNVDGNMVSKMRPTKSLDTYVGATKDFHEDGLYSVLTYGPIGSERRDVTFSYIDIGVEIISPIICLAIFDLKHLYRDILSGKRFAIWDDKLKDFVSADATASGAGTGYHFFMSKWKELTPAENESLQRQQTLDLFNKYRDIALSRYVLVYPAGLRDLEVGPDGRENDPEINKLYRKLLSTSRLVPSGSRVDSTLDAARWALQRTFNDIFLLLFNLEDGKKGKIRGKFAARNIMNGTRNVLSCMDTSSVVLGRPDEVRPTDTIVGLYQGMKSLWPVAIHAVRTRYAASAVGGDGQLNLVNKKTLQREIVLVKPVMYDLLATDEGIEKVINSFKVQERRHKPFEIANHYLALIYNDGKNFKIFYDIRDLPAGYDRNLVSPLTLAELLYLSGYDIWNDYFSLVTRFPVSGQGSTYSSTIRMTTTRSVKMLYELMDDWETKSEKPATDFPLRSEDEFVSSMAPHTSHLAVWLLNADFDGDTGSNDSLYTDEALEENREKMEDPSFWIGAGGKLTIDIETTLIELTMASLLADPT